MPHTVGLPFRRYCALQQGMSTKTEQQNYTRKSPIVKYSFNYLCLHSMYYLKQHACMSLSSVTNKQSTQHSKRLLRIPPCPALQCTLVSILLTVISSSSCCCSQSTPPTDTPTCTNTGQTSYPHINYSRTHNNTTSQM